MTIYEFSEFDSLLEIKLGPFTKAIKYLLPFLEQIHLNTGITTFDLAERLDLSRKKMFRLVEALTERNIIYCTIRNGETYPILTIKGREFMNYLENRR